MQYRSQYTGAGAAGSSTAYSLRNSVDETTPLEITVFERAHYVGGRSTTVNVFDNPSYPVELEPPFSST